MRNVLLAIAVTAVTVCGWAAQIKSRGASNAPILLEVYSDYQCPACKLLYENTLQLVMTDYVDKGKVYLVHHEFPLSTHTYAMEAACYACAANRVGKYEQVCDVLFRQQETWSATGKVADVACSVLSPDQAKKVRALVKDPSVLAEVQQDLQSGRNAKVDGTPTLILTHRQKQYRLPSAAGYYILRQFLDQLLAN